MVDAAIILLYNKDRKKKKGSERMVISEDKAKVAKREYMRKWRAENKDKVRAAQERYWAKKFEELNG